MIKFMWKNILTRFGNPRVLIRENGTQFEGNPIKEWCEEKRIHRYFTFVAHPQANGQTDILNKVIVNGLKKCLTRSKGAWIEELPMVLWSYRTSSRSSIGETSFSLTYGTEAVLPLEILSKSLWVMGFETKTNEDE